MLLLSKNNHFKFGYDRSWFVPRSSASEKWTVEYGRCKRNPNNFKLECLETARQIFQDADNQIVILFSGGVDSEVVVQSFLMAGIPFKVAVLRFKNGLNQHDISYAIKFCERNEVKFDIYELDILRFWENQLFEYADPTQCVSPLLLSTMWLVDQIDGYPVIGSGECLLVKEREPDYVPGVSPYLKSPWSLWEKEKIAAWYRHFIVRRRNGCPGFFQYTPEIILSYLQDPFVGRLINSEIHGKLTTESSKLEIYMQHFDLETRKKYTGFEMVSQFDPIYRAELMKKYSAYDQIVKTYTNDLFQKLSPLEEKVLEL